MPLSASTVPEEMVSPERGHGRTLRLALVTAALLVLLGFVAFASRSGFGHASRSQPSPAYVSWAMSVFLVLFVLLIPVAVYVYGLQAREFRAKKEVRSFQARVARRLAVIGVIPLLFLIRLYFGNRIHLPFRGEMPTPAPAAGKKLTQHGVVYHPTFQWPVLWATIALLAIAATWFWYDRRRRGVTMPFQALGEETEVVEDVAATISDAIDDLEAEPDPRRAVIAAYARMEKTFGRHGLTRRPSETAVEYLRRILLSLGSRTEPVTRLTGLFEQAKFSRREIDRTMKDDAIDALRAIRADLRSAAA